MSICEHCGKPCQHTLCLNCRYRNGGAIQEDPHPEMDVVETMVHHSRHYFRDGFTADQIQQVSPSER